MLISVLRKISQETGAFVKSKKGRQQYLIKNTVGANILKYGYCIHPDAVIPEKHPEQGPVWEWVFENRKEAYAAVGANLDGEGDGTLRKISGETLNELKEIFKYTGGIDLFQKIEEFSRGKAKELGFLDDDLNPDMEEYGRFVDNE